MQRSGHALAAPPQTPDQMKGCRFSVDGIPKGGGGGIVARTLNPRRSGIRNVRCVREEQRNGDGLQEQEGCEATHLWSGPQR